MSAYHMDPAQSRTGGYCQNENPSPGVWPGNGQGGSSSNRLGNYNPDRRRLPPYANRLREALADPGRWGQRPYSSADGRSLTLFVAAGADAWETAHYWTSPRMVQVPLFVLAPPGEDPAQFDWTLLREHPPILIWPCGTLPRAETASLVAAIIRDGVERVLVLPDDSMRLYRGGRHA